MKRSPTTIENTASPAAKASAGAMVGYTYNKSRNRRNPSANAFSFIFDPSARAQTKKKPAAEKTWESGGVISQRDSVSPNIF